MQITIISSLKGRPILEQMQADLKKDWRQRQIKDMIVLEEYSISQYGLVI